MTMFGELHFGQPPADTHFEPLPQPQKSKSGKTNRKSEISIKNAFRRLYNMTMFGELHFGRNLSQNLAKTV